MTALDGVGYLVKRVQDALRRAIVEEMGEIGLSMARFAALAALELEPGSTNRDLAARAFVTPQSMSRLVRDMEADGLVDRHPSTTSGREVTIELTHRGRELLAQARARSQAVEARLLAGLDQDDRATLRGLLEHLARNLGAVDGAPT